MTYFALPTKDFISNLNREIENSISVSYPPVNIWSNKESTFISFALAGFKESEIEVMIDNRNLIVKGVRDLNTYEKEVTWHQRHISYKNFTRKFPLAEHAVVKWATYKDGLLTIELQVIIPEDKLPKRIEINSEVSKLEDKSVELLQE